VSRLDRASQRVLWEASGRRGTACKSPFSPLDVSRSAPLHGRENIRSGRRNLPRAASQNLFPAWTSTSLPTRGISLFCYGFRHQSRPSFADSASPFAGIYGPSVTQSFSSSRLHCLHFQLSPTLGTLCSEQDKLAFDHIVSCSGRPTGTRGFKATSDKGAVT
jgi:hypothetical protein